MIKKALFTFALFSCFTWVNAQTDVLFLGNSYTAANNLPSLFQQLSASGGHIVNVDANTPGGYTYNGHSTNGTTLTKIASQNWDYVVLQEQSQIPSFSPGQVATDCYPYAQILVDSIRSNDPCTEPVFYMTWGRKYGDQNNCGVWPPVCTYDGMQWQLRRSYMELGDIHGATVCPVGMSWHTSIQGDSLLNLYTGDNSHPNIYGSYLAACTFYATIFKESPSGLTYIPAGITANEAAYLQNVAAITVLDSLDHWNIGANEVAADFDWTTNGLDVQFSDLSQNGTTYAWDFGDGNTSTSSNPQHLFTTAGLYDVTLIITGACGSDTLVQTLNLNPTGFEHRPLEDLRIFPNPAQNYVRITGYAAQSGSAEVRVFDATGRLVDQHRLQVQGQLNSEISIADLPRGSYTVEVVSGTFRKSILLVKI